MTALMIDLGLRRATAGIGVLLALCGSAHAEPSLCDPAPLRIAAAPAYGNNTIPPIPSLSNGPIQYRADSGTGDVAHGQGILYGNVILKMGDRQLGADQVNLYTNPNRAQLFGKVSYQDLNLRIQGTSGSYSDSGAELANAHFELIRMPGRGDAAVIRTTQPGIIELDQVDYTTCPAGVSDWEIRAHRINLDTNIARGAAHSAIVDFKGVPILYLPYLSFPMSDARQSGLLYPSIGTASGSGLIVSAPWYWNIAANQDLTLAPTIYSSRGVGIDSDYRLLTEATNGTLHVDYLPDDHTVHYNRSYENLNDVYLLPADWRLHVNAENVSDTAYFEQFSQSTSQSSTVFLGREFDAQYRDDVWNVRAMLLDYQTLDQELIVNEPFDRPYAQTPRIDASAVLPGPGGLKAGITTEVVDFTRGDDVNGWRADAMPTLSWDFTRPGYYVRPNLAWDFTAYRLEDVAAGQSTSPTRELPLASLDMGLEFERAATSPNGYLITLQPRLYYVYIPYRNQNELPIFDTGLPDANIVSLFRPNRYVGLDRIGDANDVTVALTAQGFQNATGQRVLSATFGERFDLSTPHVGLPEQTLPGTVPVFPATSELIPGRRSDIVADVDLTAYRNWSLHYDLAWDPHPEETDRSILSLQYRANGGQVINLGYRFDNGLFEQVEASGAWPVGGHWELYGRSVYSLMDHEATENFLGAQYHGSCWGLRVVVRRALTTREGTSDTGVFLQLELNGLSSVGSGTDTFLKSEIQGYSADTPSR
jgi:LPS-assembly protein